MSFSKPAPTTYLQLFSDSKAIDLVGLCRRLCAELQYHDFCVHGNLAKIEKLGSARSNERVLDLMEEPLVNANLPRNIPFEPPRSQDVAKFYDLPVTRYDFRIMVKPNVSQRDAVNVTGFEPEWINSKDFKYVKTTRGGCPNAANLKREELRKIYWKQRLRKANGPLLTVVLELIIDELKKQKYVGLLLPSGKVVPFEALHFVLFRYVPKELSLFEYSVPLMFDLSCACPPEIIELNINSMLVFKPGTGFFCHYDAMAINLPEEDSQGKFGRLMIIDSTCARLGMEGTNGELVYWGSSENYVKSFPAKEIHFEEGDVNYKPCSDKNDETFPLVLNVAKAILANLKFDSCGYCGEVPRKNENGETKLKKCSRCMKTYYCDALCQKMAWKGHKLECKPESK